MLTYVADEDDKSDIQRLWKKQLDHVNNSMGMMVTMTMMMIVWLKIIKEPIK